MSTRRIRANISHTSTDKYSGEVTFELLETDDSISNAHLSATVQTEVKALVDWMDNELRIRGG